jgi:PIN domain nuclease of toxin-antitoxin system
MMERKGVCDSSALLASILNEAGGLAISAIDTRLVSTVNVTETLSKLTEKGYPFDLALRSLADLNVTIVDFDRQQSFEAARLRARTRSWGLSLGDRACLALATITGSEVLTAERNWAQAAPHLTITTIR